MNYFLLRLSLLLLIFLDCCVNFFYYFWFVSNLDHCTELHWDIFSSWLRKKHDFVDQDYSWKYIRPWSRSTFICFLFNPLSSSSPLLAFPCSLDLNLSPVNLLAIDELINQSIGWSIRIQIASVQWKALINALITSLFEFVASCRGVYSSLFGSWQNFSSHTRDHKFNNIRKFWRLSPKIRKVPQINLIFIQIGTKFQKIWRNHKFGEYLSASRMTF